MLSVTAYRDVKMSQRLALPKGGNEAVLGREGGLQLRPNGPVQQQALKARRRTESCMKNSGERGNSGERIVMSSIAHGLPLIIMRKHFGGTEKRPTEQRRGFILLVLMKQMGRGVSLSFSRRGGGPYPAAAI